MDKKQIKNDVAKVRIPMKYGLCILRREALVEESVYYRRLHLSVSTRQENML